MLFFLKFDISCRSSLLPQALFIAARAPQTPLCPPALSRCVGEQDPPPPPQHPLNIYNRAKPTMACNRAESYILLLNSYPPSTAPMILISGHLWLTNSSQQALRRPVSSTLYRFCLGRQRRKVFVCLVESGPGRSSWMSKARLFWAGSAQGGSSDCPSWGIWGISFAPIELSIHPFSPGENNEDFSSLCCP